MEPRRSDFVYDLPPELIAQAPLETRSAARMLLLGRECGELQHTNFERLPEILQPGDVLVLNSTKVIPARLRGIAEPGGASIEIMLLRELNDGCWKALVRPGRRVRTGKNILLPGGGNARVTGLDEGDGSRRLQLDLPLPLLEYLQQFGETPLPPYIHRSSGEREGYHRERYQTVYAGPAGSVAAPTAGLHFTQEILDKITARGVIITRLILHVGMGTFRPVQQDDLSRHQMDPEFYSLDETAACCIREAKQSGRRVIAVGTTTTRTLESIAADNGGTITAASGWTSLFIRPGFQFQVIDGLLTNFHLPGSTLIMLVSALAGRERILAAYNEAVKQKYRFYSYGDCMLILPFRLLPRS